MNYVSLLGYLAAIASMSSFVPQAWKIIRSRQTDDISVGMYLLTVLAFALWLAYGIAQRQWPLVASNGVCFILSAFILLITILPKPAKNKVARSITNTAK